MAPQDGDHEGPVAVAVPGESLALGAASIYKREIPSPTTSLCRFQSTVPNCLLGGIDQVPPSPRAYHEPGDASIPGATFN